MATVSDNATGGTYEGVAGTLLDYYRGEAQAHPERYTVVEDEVEVAADFPRVFVDGVDQTVEDGTSDTWTPPQVFDVETGQAAAQDDPEFGHPLPGPGDSPQS